MSIAVYLINKCPTIGVHSITLEKSWSGSKPDLPPLRIFSCVCYSYILDELRTNLDVKLKNVSLLVAILIRRDTSVII